MPTSNEFVIDRDAVENVVERSMNLLRSMPPLPDADGPESGRLLQVRNALEQIAAAGARLLALSLKISGALPAFSAWPDAKLTDFIVQTEILQEDLIEQLQQVAALREIDSSLHPFAEVLDKSLRALFATLELHLDAAREHEADQDIAAGRMKKFGNAAAALAYLRRQSPEPK